MSLDRIQSVPGRLTVTPEASDAGLPGLVALGTNAGIAGGAVAGAGGAVYTAQTPKSGTVPTLASSGTVTHNGFGMCVVTTGGAVTGAIVQPGTLPGQHLVICNNSANTITMAAVGTSNVAGGTAAIVPANAALHLVWNPLDSRWYDVG
jgi:hypothetical protein